MAEFLLENGADVNAQDKGGLIPLHNASSYGVNCHVIFALFGEMCQSLGVRSKLSSNNLFSACGHRCPPHQI